MIPDSVTSIGGSAFIYTAWYDNQPDGLVYVGKFAYKMKGDCPSKVVIKEGTLGIGDYAFYECTDITSVDIPDSVTTIGDYAFYYCTSLTSIVIPDSVTTIGERAFYKCTSLTSIVIPDSVTTIGERAFYKCTSLTSIVIPDSVVSIGDEAIGYYSYYYRISGFIIYGRHKGTAAEDYAFEHGFEFMLLIGECQNCRAKIIEKDVDVMFDATCTEDGIAYWLCSNCGELGETVLPALGHDYKAVVTRPTCTEGGYTTHTCSRCKDSYVTDEVSALGHDYIIEVVPPSCTEDGYTSHTCTRCGDIYTDNKVKALGHHNFTVEVKKHPTSTQQGVMAVSCENCGLKKNVILPVFSEADYTVTYEAQTGITTYTLKDTSNGTYSVNVSEQGVVKTSGDVNDDGVVNNRDAMVLDRYVAGWDGYADRIKNIYAADLNGDEKVNNRDAMILDRYVAGWEGYDKYIKMI